MSVEDNYRRKGCVIGLLVLFGVLIFMCSKSNKIEDAGIVPPVEQPNESEVVNPSDNPSNPVSTEKDESISEKIKRSSTWIDRNFVRTIRYDGLEWMAEDLNIEGGENNYLINKVPIIDDEGYIVLNKYSKKPAGKSVKRTRYYDYENASLACYSIGWRLPTKFEFIGLMGSQAPSELGFQGDNQGFDKHRAYGYFLTLGRSRFNASLKGKFDLMDDSLYSDFPNSFFLRVFQYGENGGFWLDSSNEDYPHYTDWNKKKLSVTIYTTDKDLKFALPCRCVRNID